MRYKVIILAGLYALFFFPQQLQASVQADLGDEESLIVATQLAEVLVSLQENPDMIAALAAEGLVLTPLSEEETDVPPVTSAENSSETLLWGVEMIKWGVNVGLTITAGLVIAKVAKRITPESFSESLLFKKVLASPYIKKIFLNPIEKHLTATLVTGAIICSKTTLSFIKCLFNEKNIFCLNISWQTSNNTPNDIELQS